MSESLKSRFESLTERRANLDERLASIRKLTKTHEEARQKAEVVGNRIEMLGIYIESLSSDIEKMRKDDIARLRKYIETDTMDLEETQKSLEDVDVQIQARMCKYKPYMDLLVYRKSIVESLESIKKYIALNNERLDMLLESEISEI